MKNIQQLSIFVKNKWKECLLYFFEVAVPVWSFFAGHANLLIILLIIVVLIQSTHILINRSKNKLIPNLDWKYIHTYAEYCIEFLSRETLINHRYFKAKAIKKGVRELTGSYMWSGDKVKKICIAGVPSKDRNYPRIIFEESKDGTYSSQDKYKIELKDHMKVNETGDYKVEFELSDSARTMAPFQKTKIVRPTERLVLKVVTPPEMIKCVFFSVTTEYGDTQKVFEEPLSPEIISVGRKKREQYKIDVPSDKLKLFYTYEINWQFCDKRK